MNVRPLGQGCVAEFGLPNNTLVPTRKGEAPLLAAQHGRSPNPCVLRGCSETHSHHGSPDGGRPLGEYDIGAGSQMLPT